jgi:DNA modification methylase
VIAPGDALTTLRALPDGVAKLIISSPPYNIGKPYEVETDLAAYVAGLEPIMDELVRVLAPGGSLCWQVGNYVKSTEIVPLDIVFYQPFHARGLKLRNRIIWHYEHGLHATSVCRALRNAHVVHEGR